MGDIIFDTREGAFINKEGPMPYVNIKITKEGATSVISVAEHSVYNQPLPGDFVVEFNAVNQVSEFPLWALPTLLMLVLSTIVFYLKKGRFLRKV